jgi:hypothetical protein
MHLAIVSLLANPEHQSVLQNEAPAIFTTRAAALVPMVNGLTAHIAAQQAAITGFAADKEREEEELEDIAHEISEALVDWFEDQGKQSEAASIDLALSTWQGLRDAELLAMSKLLQQKLNATLATDAAALADYGLKPADATQLAKEIADCEELVANPAAAIAGRKALTAALRPKFREVAKLLTKMDRIVLRFRKTEAGAHFAAAWKNARIIRDLGMAGPTDPTLPTV